MTDRENHIPPRHRDDAPVDRTDAAATKADLFDTAYWLDQRLDDVRKAMADMTGDSGKITQQILGDLAGIRAEQIHLARRLDQMRVELRHDLRRELRQASTAPAPAPARRRAGRWGPILVSVVPVLLILLFVSAWPEPVRTLLPAGDLWAGMISWLRGVLPASGSGIPHL